ncbi:MAG: type II toxin-antitoxin system RelE/ParE family toxin [Planctomycetes bacterium]|nr:type II toxin-antitoxin system RelE/ParE family toxin [Planctomycetota bacterium]
MKQRVKTSARALVDLETALEYFEGEESGLGARFLEAVDAAIQRARKNPAAYRAIWGAIRRVQLSPFRYNLFFRHDDRLFKVLRILHAQRDPDVIETLVQSEDE